MKEKKKLFCRVWDLPYGRTTPYHLFDACKNSRDVVQKFQLQKKIPVHNGCVNSIAWNETGRYLLSGSDDQHLSVINGADYSVCAYVRTGHHANIFSAKFLPNAGDTQVVSSSGDGTIIYSNLERPDTSVDNKFNCHRGTAYEIMTVPNDPNTFLSCGEDRTVRWFDIRTKTSCSVEDCKEDVLIFCRSPVTSIAVNPLIPYQLAVGCADSSVQIFDRRMLSTQATAGFLSNGFRALATYFTVPDFPQSRRITSLCYSNDGQEMLVSYSSDYIYLFDVKGDMGKKPKLLSGADGAPYSRTRPVMKRLRVRGDWSDTGPNSRPETEAENPTGGSSQNNLVRRMTDILTRMLFSSNQNRSSQTASGSSESSPIASSQSEDLDAENDSNPDGAAVNLLNLEAGTSQSIENNDTSQTVPVDTCTQTDTVCNSKCYSCGACMEGSDKSQSSDDGPYMPSEPKNDTCDIDAKDLTLKSEEQFESKPSTSSLSQSTEDHEQRNDSSEMRLSEPTNVADASSDADEKPEADEVFRATSEPNQELSVERDFESETEEGVQSIEPGVNIPNANELLSPRSPSPDAAAENLEEVELMMEVDSWDSDSDEGSTQPHISRSTRASRRRARTSSSNDETENDPKKHVRKEKPPKSVRRPNVKKIYTGHRNARTMIKESTFWGDNFVMSGSDCGHIFIWDRHTTELVMIMEADHHVVNCLQPHPFDPILASSGIDYDIKIWAPLREEPFFDIEKANEIIHRNKIMLEVTKDTITVPASFMFNMFTTLTNLRNGHSQLYRWSRASRAAREARNQEAANRDQDSSNR